VLAFADPVLVLHNDPDDVWFAKLVLRVAGDPWGQDGPVGVVLFDPMAASSSPRRAAICARIANTAVSSGCSFGGARSWPRRSR